MDDVEHARLRVGVTGQDKDPLGWIGSVGMVRVNEADGRQVRRRIHIVLLVHLDRRIGAAHAMDLDRVDLDPAVIAPARW